MSRTTAKLVSTSAQRRQSRRAGKGAEAPLIPAARFKRIGAFVLDVILLPFLWILTSFLPVIGGVMATFIYMSLNGIAVGSGRSLGRAATEQRLLMRDGSRAEHGRVVARNALRAVLWMAFLPFFVDVLLLLFGDGRLLADRICGTRVFEDPEKLKAARKSESEQIVDHVAAQDALWDDRHEQEELEQIATSLAFGEGDAEEAELAEFERRLRADTLPEEASDPFLAELAEAAPATAGVEHRQEVAEEQVVEQR